ncbi:hypothetical protein ACFP7A_08105 [Sporolactobacillus kofuensis]|uniref:Anion-transporting ATPase-like domain-containing protein n=1 Tax=Sporolactobacillus kofuensis TaxID=269672 RepID=A0ABW1WE74_9BACL|nr:hypothetical protein [Sporolactobacillus kofuensis]MCO7175716.1 hypothetical protein [Sporolactobacillus kofuensis]
MNPIEAERLAADLRRAGIAPTWWIVNQSLIMTDTAHPLLKKRAENERVWIERVEKDSNHQFAVIPWQKRE